MNGNLRLRITSIEAIPISIPSRGFNSALGRFATYEYGIVIVRTDAGIEGYGEISTLWEGASGVQCALVYTLLGGRTRESVVLSRSLSMASPAEMAAEARRVVKEGFGCVKVKVGRPGRDDTEAVAAVRDAIGPDVLLRVDANMGWPTSKDAIRHIKAMEPYDIHSVEQPLPPIDVDALKLVRQSVDTPIMVDESVWGPRDAWEILRAEAADMLNIYVAESGGLTNASLIFRMAEVAGVPCVIGAMPELGIGTAAAVHLGVAMTNLHDLCDACGVIYHDVEVVRERFVVRDGRIWPPEDPGLGVTLDYDQVDRYRQR